MHTLTHTLHPQADIHTHTKMICYQRQRGWGGCVPLVLLLIISSLGSVVANKNRTQPDVPQYRCAAQVEPLVPQSPPPPVMMITVPTAVQQQVEYDKIVTNLKAMDSDAICEFFKDGPGQAICDVVKDCPPATAGQVNTGNTEAVADLSDKPECSKQQLITCLIALGNLHPSEKKKLASKTHRPIQRMTIDDFLSTTKNLRVPEIQQFAFYLTGLFPRDLSRNQFVFESTKQRRVVKFVHLAELATQDGPVNAKTLDFESIDRIFDSLVEEYSTKNGWSNTLLNSNLDVTSTSREEPFRRIYQKLEERPDDLVISDCLVRILIGGSIPVFDLPGDNTLPGDVQRKRRNRRIRLTFNMSVATLDQRCHANGAEEALNLRYSRIMRSIEHKLAFILRSVPEESAFLKTSSEPRGIFGYVRRFGLLLLRLFEHV
eukprot:GHVQ01016583.1.p1 GENE.GHVQ01016583.1~~GHVQ01016583.1.p1  ORF type:complete len:473 (+),score=60.44 GHVQ01016583.1:129-1421(+)